MGRAYVAHARRVLSPDRTDAADTQLDMILCIVADIGIEFGKMLYLGRDNSPLPVTVDHSKAVLLLSLLGCFFVGGVAGAYGFNLLGAASCAPLAAMLLLVSLPACLPARRGSNSRLGADRDSVIFRSG